MAYLDAFNSAIVSPITTWVLLALGGGSIVALCAMGFVSRRNNGLSRNPSLDGLWIGVTLGLFALVVFAVVSLLTQMGIKRALDA